MPSRSQSVPQPSVHLGFRYLFGMARRCEIAKGPSSALADKLVHKHPSLPLRRLERSSYDGFIRNVQPCVLAFAHFLECWRDELASYALSINRTAYKCVVVEHSILSSSYDEETVFSNMRSVRHARAASSIMTLTRTLSGAGPTTCSIFTVSVGADGCRD